MRALQTAQRTGRTFRETFPTLAEVVCECALCNGRVYRDEVALLVIEDGVMAFPEAVRRKVDEEDAAIVEGASLQERALRAFVDERRKAAA